MEKSRGRLRSLRVVLSDGRAFELDKEIFRFYRLKEGFEVPEEQFNRILDQSYEKLAKDYALDFLGSRARSETEVRDRLRARKIRGVYIDKAIEGLKRTGLIDDSTYASRCCHDLLDRKPMGPYLLRQELKKRGIPDDLAEKTIEAYFADNDISAVALRALRKKARFLNIPDERERKKKIYDFLMRRGFGYEEIGETLSLLERETDGTGAQNMD